MFGFLDLHGGVLKLWIISLSCTFSLYHLRLSPFIRTLYPIDVLPPWDNPDGFPALLQDGIYAPSNRMRELSLIHIVPTTTKQGTGQRFSPQQRSDTPGHHPNIHLPKFTRS